MEIVEVVIRVPKELYEAIIKDIEQENWYDEDAPIDKTMRAIANGTVLSKGHGRLIDADAEIKAMENMKVSGDCFKACVKYVKLEMESAPTIIEADKENKE